MPHSEISGSQPVSGSPKLIAAVHVLHRLSLSRHPPCALSSLTVSLRHASIRSLFRLPGHDERHLVRSSSVTLKFAPRTRASRASRPSTLASVVASSLLVFGRYFIVYVVVREQGLLSRLLLTRGGAFGAFFGTSSAVIRAPTSPKRDCCVTESVELTGLEPVTSGLQSQRSPN